MRLRESLLRLVTWKIGYGSSISAFAQPWFQGAVEVRGQNMSQNSLLVKELLNENTNLWDVNKLIECFGYDRSMQIIVNVQPPVRSDAPDRLIFLPAASGMFSVKKAYSSLKPELEQVECFRLQVEFFPLIQLQFDLLHHSEQSLSLAVVVQLF